MVMLVLVMVMIVRMLVIVIVIMLIEMAILFDTECDKFASSFACTPIFYYLLKCVNNPDNVNQT